MVKTNKHGLLFALVIAMFLLESVALGAKTKQRTSKKQTSFVTNRTPPTAETLLRWTPPRGKSPKRLIRFDSEDLLDLLSLYKKVPVAGNVVLVGNGMYPAYLLLKGLTKGTRAFDRLLFLPVSQDLAFKASSDGSLEKCFSSLGLDRRPNDLYVVDSVSGQHTHEHSLFHVARALRRYLKKANDQRDVVAVGIPEEGKHNYADDKLERHLENQRQNGSCMNRRYLHCSIPWEAVGQFYSKGPDKELHWSGKYKTLGEDGMPVGTGIRMTQKRQTELATRLRKLILEANSLKFEDADLRRETDRLFGSAPR